MREPGVSVYSFEQPVIYCYACSTTAQLYPYFSKFRLTDRNFVAYQVLYRDYSFKTLKLNNRTWMRKSNNNCLHWVLENNNNNNHIIF